MSATTATVTVETNTASWRKRPREDDTTSQMDLKRPRCYYFRLESESSKASEEDTESICSLQDRETDVVRDTSDTDSKSGCSDADEYEVHYEEYDVASLSGSENEFGQSSSDSEASMMLAAAAAVICDTSLENWITDCEDSDNSSLEESSFGKMDFSTCVQCKSNNDNPLFRYCEKCFQTCRQCKMRKTFKCFPLCILCYKDRKKFYPPRPRRNKKSRKDKQKEPPVKLDMLRSCLNNLSQDSGIGSSQEWQVFGMAQIVVPDDHLPSGTSQISTITESNENVDDDSEKKSAEVVTSSSLEQIGGNKSESQETKVHENTSSFSSTDTNCNVDKGRKRYLSESSLSDFEVKPHPNKVRKITQPESEASLSLSQTSDWGSEISTTSIVSTITDKSNATGASESSELCILCNDAPKDSIFLHSKVAHQCCCYGCAKRTVKTRKRCPICNVTVNKVLRVIKS